MQTVLKLAMASLCLTPAAAWSAPITFNTALPVHEGGYVWREQLVFMQSAGDPTPARRDMQVTGLVSVLGYGVTGDFALFGMLPWFDKRLDMRMGGQDLSRSKSAMGDLTVLGRYTAYQYDAPGQTLRIAPFLGVKAPTGEDNARDGFGRLPPALQPGSGSWDALGGAVLTYQTLDFQIDSQVSYQANGEANGFQAGNRWQVDGSLQYRLLPRRLGAGVPAFLYGVLEANLLHADKDRSGGSADANSGGTTLFITPGLQYVTKKWILEAGVQIPVHQQLNGSALETDYRLTAGFRVNF
ncbi:transporter [Pseudomonas sp. sp1636]|uniref:transporter n=1 Tax=Pseudomonas sp. sp1636 TaxID=3036707 RepID=UPI0025A584A5|nr:transporter [Pseudomonas sp. sp1636]MDM8349499.1 transporter [Pseudomonas sp. sp1636]